MMLVGAAGTDCVTVVIVEGAMSLALGTETGMEAEGFDGASMPTGAEGEGVPGTAGDTFPGSESAAFGAATGSDEVLAGLLTGSEGVVAMGALTGSECSARLVETGIPTNGASTKGAFTDGTAAIEFALGVGTLGEGMLMGSDSEGPWTEDEPEGMLTEGTPGDGALAGALAGCLTDGALIGRSFEGAPTGRLGGAPTATGGLTDGTPVPTGELTEGVGTTLTGSEETGREFRSPGREHAVSLMFDWKEWSELTLNLCASTDSEDDNSREGREFGCEHSV